ncbi:YggN family protein [Colwellia sp. D2M02]|uniref:DUF2884 family protein n=1 Tax=Colwellia sp. D2M02 TaxID=2841562 RepID=UPI001C0A1A5E|nr:DUF2884 family protein [Colwellia sp. D2M02]MBU2893233.1 YggN family protein [Colwellia sp. D2M02]
MTLFKKTLTACAVTSLFVATPILANNSCNVNLSGQVNIDKSTIEFFAEDNNKQSLYKIENDKSLLINNSSVSLTAKQQALVTQYSQNIKALVPQVETVVVEGVELAIDGVNLAFNGLLGEGNQLAKNLTQELEVIRDDALARYSLEKGFTVGGDNDELQADEFESKIESAVERSITNSMGVILIALGQEMLSANGEGENFETRMEKFGETIEVEMESRTEAIEAKAQELCHAIAKVDVIEEQLKSSIDALSNINVVTVSVK